MKKLSHFHIFTFSNENVPHIGSEISYRFRLRLCTREEMPAGARRLAQGNAASIVHTDEIPRTAIERFFGDANTICNTIPPVSTWYTKVR